MMSKSATADDGLVVFHDGNSDRQNSVACERSGGSKKSSEEGESCKLIRMREHVHALNRNRNYTVILKRFLSGFDADEFLVLTWLLSLAPREHPSKNRMSADLGIGKAHINAALEKLRNRCVIYSDFMKSGQSRKYFWHISHPCYWKGFHVRHDPAAADPESHKAVALTELPIRVNEARAYILSQSDSLRLPNLLFRVPLSAGARRVYTLICTLSVDEHPTIKGIASRLGIGWRAADRAIKELDAAVMIVIATQSEARFGKWNRQYFHTTDVHFWKFPGAAGIYTAPQKPSLLMSMERSTAQWRLRGAPDEALNRSCMTTADQTAVMDHTTAVQTAVMDHTTAFQCPSTAVPITADFTYPTSLQPQSCKDMGRCNKTSKQRQKERKKERHETDPVSMRQLMPRKRVLSISSSADHVWQIKGNRTFDHDLWPDLIQDMANGSDEAQVRLFVRYVIKAYKSSGSRQLPYNSAVMDDLREAFESGPAPEAFAGSDMAADAGGEVVDRPCADAPASKEGEAAAGASMPPEGEEAQEGEEAPEWENDQSLLVDCPETSICDPEEQIAEAIPDDLTASLPAILQPVKNDLSTDQSASAHKPPSEDKGLKGRPPSHFLLKRTLEILTQQIEGKPRSALKYWKLGDQNFLAELCREFGQESVEEVMRAIP